MKFQCVRIWRVWQSFTYKYVPRFEGNWLFEEVFFTLSSIKLCFFAETAPVTTHWGDVILHANLLFLNFMWNGVKSVHRCWRSFPKKPLYTTHLNNNFLLSCFYIDCHLCGYAKFRHSSFSILLTPWNSNQEKWQVPKKHPHLPWKTANKLFQKKTCEISCPMTCVMLERNIAYTFSVYW